MSSNSKAIYNTIQEKSNRTEENEKLEEVMVMIQKIPYLK